MIQIDKRSVLTLEDFQLQSLSQCVNIADNQYYLSELVNKYNKKTIYTWEEISVLKSRYFNLSNEFNFKNYLEKGKKIQLLNKWPQTKMIAFMEIKEKFWLDNSDSEQVQNNQNNYEFQQEKEAALKNKYQLKKSKKIQKEKDRKKHRKDGQNENQKRKEIKQLLQLSRSDSDSDSHDQIQHSQRASLIFSKSQKWSTSQNKKNKKQKQQKQQQQKQKEKEKEECKKGEYLRVKKIHISNDNKQKQINYIVENILGQNKIITSSKLKQTHIFEVIAFLEQCLNIKKK